MSNKSVTIPDLKSTLYDFRFEVAKANLDPDRNSKIIGKMLEVEIAISKAKYALHEADVLMTKLKKELK